MKTKFYTKEVLQKLEAGIAERLEDSGDAIIDSSKSTTPVRTGKLLSSIEKSGVSDNSIAVGTDVEYAKYVEFGTVKMAPKYFLTKAFQQSIPAIQNIFKKEIQ